MCNVGTPRLVPHFVSHFPTQSPACSLCGRPLLGLMSTDEKEQRLRGEIRLELRGGEKKKVSARGSEVTSTPQRAHGHSNRPVSHRDQRGREQMQQIKKKH